MAAGLVELARDLGDKTWCNGEVYSLADIATGCALGYLDLRHAEIDWRAEYSNLARLAEKLDKRPSFQDTAPPAQ
jgi:glutathione S-transferase